MPILLVEWSAQISEVIDKDLSDSTTSAYSIVYIELDAAFIIQTMFNFFEIRSESIEIHQLAYRPITHIFLNH